MKFIVAISWFKIKVDNKFYTQQLCISHIIQRMKLQSAEIQYVE